MLLISVKLLAKYVIIIYVRRLNRSRFKVASKAKFPAGLGVKNG